MKKLIFVVFLGVLFSANAWADSIYFMPYEAPSAIKRLVTELKNAQSEVKIAIYSFTNREISKAIRDSAKRGVKFSIIFDYDNSKNKSSQIGYLAKLKNVEVCTLEGRRAKDGRFKGIMHQKLAIIDDKMIIFGSANWSKSAFETNYEVLLISQNSDYIKQANSYFAKMKSECAEF